MNPLKQKIRDSQQRCRKGMQKKAQEKRRVPQVAEDSDSEEEPEEIASETIGSGAVDEGGKFKCEHQDEPKQVE